MISIVVGPQLQYVVVLETSPLLSIGKYKYKSICNATVFFAPERRSAPSSKVRKKRKKEISTF